jgi:phosphopantothenoylcysteine decarboxylase
MIADTRPLRLLYWIMCAAPPVQDWQEAARQLHEDGWDLYAIPTQTAASWLDLGSLAQVTGHAVRTKPMSSRRRTPCSLLRRRSTR